MTRHSSQHRNVLGQPSLRRRKFKNRFQTCAVLKWERVPWAVGSIPVSRAQLHGFLSPSTPLNGIRTKRYMNSCSIWEITIRLVALWNRSGLGHSLVHRRLRGSFPSSCDMNRGMRKGNLPHSLIPTKWVYRPGAPDLISYKCHANHTDQTHWYYNIHLMTRHTWPYS